MLRCESQNGAPFTPGGLMMSEGPPSFRFEPTFEGSAKMEYLALPAIDQELWKFLNAAIPGTKACYRDTEN